MKAIDIHGNFRLEYALPAGIDKFSLYSGKKAFQPSVLQITILREPGEAQNASPGSFLLLRMADVLGKNHAAQLFQQFIPAIEDSPVVHPQLPGIFACGNALKIQCL